ncbi:hypothetical protein MMC34_004257 [Xylographa carneopallida]|nr:hypothetical protein [Xylographa carneopallida]
MSLLLSIALTPFILLVSVPLFIFAIITTSLAFSTLFLRVLIVYVELAVVVIHNHFSLSPSPKQEPVLSRKKSGRSIAGSRSSSGSLTPKLPVSDSGLYPSTPLARDFEGVGGWRFPDAEDDDSEALWTGMNARLELPALASMGGELKAKHERSLTTGALISDRPMLKGVGFQRPRPVSAFGSGTASPEEVYADAKTSRSAADLGEAEMVGLGLGMNMGKVRMKHRKSSSSSTGSSGKTAHTLGMTG